MAPAILSLITHEVVRLGVFSFPVIVSAAPPRFVVLIAGLAVIVAVLFPSRLTAQALPATNLLAHWRFDGSGTRAADGQGVTPAFYRQVRPLCLAHRRRGRVARRRGRRCRSHRRRLPMVGTPFSVSLWFKTPVGTPRRCRCSSPNTGRGSTMATTPSQRWRRHGAGYAAPAATFMPRNRSTTGDGITPS
jgi:hypothetical protein